MNNRNYDGKLWYQDKSGYWARKEKIDGKSKLVYQHIYTYEKLTGCKVFKGQEIHHMDKNKSNNTADNLVCLTVAQHKYLHNFGKKCADETKQKISDSNMGHIVSDETKQKISKSNMGKKLSCLTKQKISETNHTCGLRSNNKTKFKGVCFHKAINKYRARITLNKVEKYLGVFPTAEEAARAYDEAAKKAWGDACFLNYPTR